MVRALIFTLSILLPVTVLAQETEPVATTTEAATTTEVTIEETPEPITENVSPTPSGQLSTRSQDRIINLAANISNRFDAVILRLENIASRLDARIQKQKNDGFDTSAAEAALAQARSHLAPAKAEMSTIDAAVVTAVRSRNPIEAWREVRQKYLTARESIRSGHQELRNAIIGLRQTNSEVVTPTDINQN